MPSALARGRELASDSTHANDCTVDSATRAARLACARAGPATIRALLELHCLRQRLARARSRGIACSATTGPLYAGGVGEHDACSY